MTDLDPPENPNSPGHRISAVPLVLRIAVYGMGLALVVMLVLVGDRFMDRKAARQSTAADRGVAWLIELEANDPASKDEAWRSAGGVKSASTNGRILTVVVDDPSGDQVILIDTKKGEIIGKIRMVTP